MRHDSQPPRRIPSSSRLLSFARPSRAAAASALRFRPRWPGHAGVPDAASTTALPRVAPSCARGVLLSRLTKGRRIGARGWGSAFLSRGPRDADAGPSAVSIGLLLSRLVLLLFSPSRSFVSRAHGYRRSRELAHGFGVRPSRRRAGLPRAGGVTAMSPRRRGSGSRHRGAPPGCHAPPGSTFWTTSEVARTSKTVHRHRLLSLPPMRTRTSSPSLILSCARRDFRSASAPPLRSVRIMTSTAAVVHLTQVPLTVMMTR